MSPKQAVDSEQKTDKQLNQVREILFGEQARATSQRLEQLEKRFSDQVQDLRGFLERLEKHQQATEAELRKTAEAIRADLEKTRKEQAKALADWKSSGEAQLTAAAQHFDSQLDSLGAQLDSHVKHLAQSRVDRKALSGMMTDLAKKLHGEEEAEK